MTYKKNNDNANRMITPMYCRIFYQGNKGFGIRRHFSAAKPGALGLAMTFFLAQSALAVQVTDSATMTVRVTIPPRIQAAVKPLGADTSSGQHGLCISARDAGLYRVMAQGLGKDNRFSLRSGTQEVVYQVSFKSSGAEPAQRLNPGEYSRIQQAVGAGVGCNVADLSQVQVAFPEAEQSQKRYADAGLRLTIAAE